jgi:hypothetical protein
MDGKWAAQKVAWWADPKAVTRDGVKAANLVEL